MSGLSHGTSTPAIEELAEHLPGAKVVKAIPPFAEVPHSGSMQAGTSAPNFFVCSDDAAARKTVAELVHEI